MLPRYFEIPEIVSGYELGDFFWIVRPEGTTNLCINPSFETNTTGWTAVGSALARIATWQTRGVYSLEVTPTAAVNDGVYFGTVATTTGQWYTLSLDFQGAGQRPYQIYFATSGGALLGTAFKFLATGRKQRIKVSWFETGGASRRVYITKDNHANTSVFNIDAVQIENKAYATTYCLDPETLVSTKTGIRKLSEINVGEHLSNERGEFNEVTNLWPIRKAAYQVILENGSEIIASGDHKFLMMPKEGMPGHRRNFRGKWDWKETDDLQPGDFIRLNTLPSRDKNTDEQTAFPYLFGYLLGDGYLCSRTSRGQPLIAWTFGIREQEIGKTLEALYRKTFAPSPFSGYPSLRQTNENEIELRTQNRETAARFIAEGFPADHSAKEKYLPKEVWAYSRINLLAFFAGLIDSDGCVDERGNLHIDSASEKLIRELHRLISIRLGIQGWFGKYTDRHSFSEGERTSFRLSFKASDTAALRDLGLRLLHPRKAKRLESATGNKRRNWARIKVIVPLGERLLIDLTLAPQHTFVANGFVTHNCDGDQRGVVPGRTDFYWSGTPHASSSVRVENCGIGGRMYSLKDLGFRLLSVVGLGLAGMQLQMIPQARGGAFFQDTVFTDRQFNLIGQVEGSTLSEVQRKRQTLVELLRLDSVTPTQPIALHYIPTDNCGEPIGDELEILCLPDGDVLPMTLDNRHAERLSIPFRLYLPFVARDDGEVGAALGYQTSLANADYILRRAPNGQWDRLSGASALSAAVNVVFPLSDGRVAVGGTFLNADGDVNADYLAVYDPTTDVFSAFNATPLNGAVLDILQMSNGNLLIAGKFTNAGADANADYVAQVNIGTGAFSSINATPLGAEAHTLALLSDGNYAVGGSFVNAGADANADYIAKINGATFAYSAFNATPLSTFSGGGAGFELQDIIPTLDGNAILLGSFLNAGGDANADLACRLNVSTGAFEALTNTSLDTAFFALSGSVAPNGLVYIGGRFTNGGGDTNADYIVVYNGKAYLPLSTGMDNIVYKVLALQDGTIFVSGAFTRAGTLAVVDRSALWNGSAFVPVDIDFPGTPDVQALAQSKDGAFYVGYTTAGTALVSTVTNVANAGSKAYPRIKFVGPGTLYQLKNWTTGRSLWFNLTLFAGETAALDFSNPQNVTFESNLRGNLLGTILRGSSLDFFLQPGANSISLFIAGTTDGNTAATMSWRETHHSLDAAIPVHSLP